MRECEILLISLLLILLFNIVNGARRGIKIQESTSVKVTLNGKEYVLDWNPDYDQQTITFEMSMKERLKNNHWILDGYIDENENLKVDLKQDCRLILDDPKHGKVIFQKKFATCDIRDYAVDIGTTQFLFATGPSTKFRNLKDKNVFHDFRYNQLLQYPVSLPDIDREAKTMEIRAIDAHVPNIETTYWCAIVKLDESLRKRKHHVIKMEPLITPGNEHLVHHMEVFHCVYDTDASEEYNGDCNSKRKPKMAHMCSKVLAAWAMGAGPVVYPKEAGLPFGGPGFRPLVMVEIHYNNPELASGIVDNSGFRFTFTPRLRKNDAAIMELGLIYSDANSIPPGQTAFPLTGYCTSECTQKLPKEGIHIFGTQLHAHLTGRKLWTSHYRNGIKIREINRDNHFSSHWQHIVALQKHVHVLPGDVLTTTCVYDTKDKKDFVFGGYEIENEMCVNYIYYYPASDVEVCKSAVDNSTLHKWFKSKGIRDSNLLIHQKYQKLEKYWNSQLTTELLELYTTGSLNMACLDHGGDLFKGRKWEKIPQPETFAGAFDKSRANMECPSLND